MALVTGAVGSGKTGLLDAFCRQVAAEGGRVLSAVGSQSEQGLPFGIVDQFLQGRRLTAEPLTCEIPLSVPVAERGGGKAERAAAVDRIWAQISNELFFSMVDLTDHGPLVLAIDDVHHADASSLHCLLYLVRRLRHAPIMVLITEPLMLRPPNPLFHAELSSQPYFTRLTLPPLSAEALAQLLQAGTGAAPTCQLPERYLSMTGGSPLLAQALLDDPFLAFSASDEFAASVTGNTFNHAVLSCLYRHEPSIRKAAHALAVLGRSVSPEILGQLLDVTPSFAAQALWVLQTSGLVELDQLRHERILQAILGDLTVEEQRRLHRRAAAVLYDHGADAYDVAEHLIAANCTDEPWAVPVLQEAASQAFAMGRSDVAASCLRLSKNAGDDGERQAVSDDMPAGASLSHDPPAGGCDLPDAPDRARSRAQSVGTVLSAVPGLLWQGRAEEAVAKLSALSADAGEDDGVAAEVDGTRLHAMMLLASLCYPDQLHGVRKTPVAWAHLDDAASGIGPALRSVAVLAEALRPAAGNDVAAAAEQIIQRHQDEEDDPIGLLAAPLAGMLYVGRADRVALWTNLLLNRPAVRRTTTWRALVHAIRAEALLRLGNVRDADQHARTALETMPSSSWGVLIAAPLATLITTATERGRLHEAERWLTHPAPPDMFRTPLGLHYLAARARYHLAVERAGEAGEDLRRCGELMRFWGLDIAGLVPWRLELAKVELGLGNTAEATRLLEEQLRVSQGMDDRTRSQAMRLLAAVAPPDGERQPPARTAEASRNAVEPTGFARRAVYALRRPGDGEAHELARQAHQMAQDGGTTVQRLLERELYCGVTGAAAADASKQSDGLSEAERRVAVLAAQGHTNRQISSKLYITVSTVEQHLTKVYRKLDVKRRSDLPARLVVHPEPR